MNNTRGDFLRDVADVKSELDVTKYLEVVNGKQNTSKSPRTEVNSRAEPPPTKLPTTRPVPAPRTSRAQELNTPSRVGLQNITTRLSPDTMDLLKRMVLQQQLKNQKPDTRQDIIEVALREWARKHGYHRQQAPTEDPSNVVAAPE